MLTLLLGAARSGKSRLAQGLAQQYERVCYVATAPLTDDPEMIARIERHRADRPPGWQTLEEPLQPGTAVERLAAEYDAIVIDCLTVWLSNLLWEHRDGETGCAEQAAQAQIQSMLAASGDCRVILVSNEVGAGIVPESAVARRFRDLQGLVNQWAAEAADEVALVVAGLPLHLKQVQR